MSEWKPIESAPKDGTPLLVYEAAVLLSPAEIVVARYDADYPDGFRWRGTYGDGDAYWTPTHWMPLPAPPA